MKKLSTYLIALVLLLSFSMAENCYGQEWTSYNNGLYGGNVRTIIAKGNFVFAGTYSSGIFKSEAGGSWKSANNGLLDRNITSFAVSGDSLFVGTYYAGIYLSLDNGETWKSMRNPSVAIQTTALFIHGTTILGGTENGVIKSVDLGKNWIHASGGLPQYTTINTIYRHKGKYYAGTTFGGLYVSNDGTTWTRVNFFPADENVSLIEYQNSTLFVSTRHGLFASPDDGVTFARVDNNVLENIYVTDLITFQGTLFAATNNGLYQSPPSGNSWTKVPVSSESAYDYATSLLIVNNKLLLGHQTDGVLQSSNGTNWTNSSEGLTALSVTGFAKRSNYLYAKTVNGIYYATDQNPTWQKLRANGFVGGGKINSLVTFGDTLISILPQGEFIFSTNNGTTWGNFPMAGLPSSPYVKWIVNGNVYADAGASNLYVIRPGNTSWTEAIPGVSTTYFTGITSSGDTLFATTDKNKVYVSKNNGLTWNAASTGLPPSFLSYGTAIIKSTIWLSTNESIYKSSDAGSSWTKVTVPENKSAGRLESGAEYLFASSYPSIYFSNDGGQSWANTSGMQFENIRIESFISKDNYMYVGTAMGVYRMSLDNFAHQITSISPIYGPPGTVVTIAGKNFSSIPSGQTIKLNDITVPVQTANTNQLTFTVPENATAGKITVTINGKSVVSNEKFCIGVKPTITASKGSNNKTLLTSSVATGNQWFFNNQKIEGATSQSLLVDEIGTYKVVITIGECTFEDSYQLIVTDVEHLDNKSVIDVYPNPTKNQITVDLENSNGQSVLIKVLNAEGKDIYQNSAEPHGRLQISLDAYRPGLYFLQVIDQGHVETMRIVKE